MLEGAGSPTKEKTDHKGRFLLLAAELGFEPRHTESESAVLPLHNSAKYYYLFRTDYILTHKFAFVKRFLTVFENSELFSG